MRSWLPPCFFVWKGERVEREMTEIFEDQQEITTLKVIWARQLVSPQPKLGPGPVAERARADEFDAVGGACGEASEMAIAVLHGALKVGLADSPEVDTLDDP